MLFVTVACGACSGFHGLVSSGTTSKQIAKESDCRPIGYGGMLLEGVVALIALATVMMLSPGDPSTKLSPDRIYAQGLATFVQQFGISYTFAMAFVLLAFATFIFDTLDVATRLGRYVLQELFGWRGLGGRITATFMTLVLPAWFVTVTVTEPSGKVIPAWRVFWTAFGASNQLLAGLTLLGLTAWLRRSGRSWKFTAVPCAFMMGMTLWALGILGGGWVTRLKGGGTIFDPVGIASFVLMGLALSLLVEGIRALRVKSASTEQSAPASAR
jgi:carbon starvation protein